MPDIDFDAAFAALTGNPPFPWQRALYERFLSDRPDNIPASCNLPTGLGKTSVIAVWLIALAAHKDLMPRRLVYVVNRRTVVDQTTTEVEKLRANLSALKEAWFPELAISTLRGQFADNREWSADPSRPAVICGTVDMIGSRLLFSGYGCGFKTRPLHAGFLGQDSLVVHDEAHLEPAFQDLLIAIEKEQRDGRTPDFRPMKVMELTATSRSGGEPFGLTADDHKNDMVRDRINATKKLHLVANKDEKKLADVIADLAMKFKDSSRAVLVFVRKVEDVDKVIKKLPKGSYEQLTGTLRGYERDGLVNRPIFQRFLPESNLDKDVKPQEGTVYLVCTSAGEVGVNISADHLVCDLSTFDSMAQRFGRVNRFGLREDTEIHVIHPKAFKEDDPIQPRLKKTLELLQQLNSSASPAALGEVMRRAVEEGSGAVPMTTDRTEALRKFINVAFAPQPTVLPVTDILFDAWALTSIRDKLPGRPPVEQYLHGVAEWQPPETHVAWREEVERLQLRFKDEAERKDRERGERKRLGKFAAELLEDYALKPHELLRDRSDRVVKHLAAIAERHPTVYAWLVDDEGTVEVFALRELADKDKKDRIEKRTVLLPPSVGGLRDGLLDGGPEGGPKLDVADTARDDKGNLRRKRVSGDDVETDPDVAKMRLIRRIDFPAGEDEDAEGRSWHWFEAVTGDGEGSKANKFPVLWRIHTKDVVDNTTAIVGKLPLGDLPALYILAAHCHDLGKKRKQFQTVLGNRDYPKTELAKSGKKGGRIEEKYRHEFGSLIDTQVDPQGKRTQLPMISGVFTR